MAETHENSEGLYLLACVCDLESQKLEYALLVPIGFPKKKRSLPLRRRPKRFTKPRSPPSSFESCDHHQEVASNLKVSVTVLGKRCFFQQQVDDDDDADKVPSFA